MAKLQRSSLESYFGIAIAITSVVFPLTWYIKLALLIILAGIVIDLSWHSPKTLGWKEYQKALLCCASLVVLTAFAWKPIRNQYHQETTPAPNNSSNESADHTPAPSAGTAAPATRPTPPQPALPPPATTEMRPQPSEPGKLDLMFKDSPLLTKRRRETIKKDIAGFAAYLQALGVPIPTDIPPIGIDTTNPKATGWSFNEQSNNKYYYNKFTLQQGMLDDRKKITEAFCTFVIGRFIYKQPPQVIPYLEKQTPQQFYDATHTPEQIVNTYRWMASVQLKEYLNHSYWDQQFAKNQRPVCPDQGDGTAYYFWKIRMRFGKEFTDKLAVFTLRAVVDKPYTDPRQHYRQYFYERLKTADSVIDNENAKMPGIDAILKECAWLPN
jgi:hypothetical protein